ncbi:allophanate hydrolase [Cellulomonas soli]|uniref:allophanate hydrolase n=1 Tax=Cellulomonas soli TaxID=931535 RepID=UPI003F8504D5
MSTAVGSAAGSAVGSATAARDALPLGLAAVERAYARIVEVDRPEVWIHLRPRDDVEADVRTQAARAQAGEDLPLLGRLVAVKDNIDVAGLPTTAACPGAARMASADATAVARLRHAGAVVLGKTNLDQFATGLVGTRSPYGAVRSADHLDRISGGSSSGSAVAVALGIVDLALGTDTAGSGRVPAALQGIVGVKPTPGLVPTTGVLPACRSLDCVSVLARELPLAALAVALMSGPDGTDALARAVPDSAPLAGPEHPVLAVPRPADLDALDPAWRAAFDRHVGLLLTAGWSVREIDLTPFLAAARLLYDGAFVAERYAAVGPLVEAAPEGLDPVVGAIIGAARDLPAHRYAADLVTLAGLRAAAEAALGDADALLLPTTTHHPTFAEVAADPVGVNSRLGTFTNFCNLFGYAAVAVPIEPTRPTAPGVPAERVGVTVLTPAFADAAALDLAARVLALADPGAWTALDGDPADGATAGASAAGALTADAERAVDLLVVGAHLSGLPLHPRLRRHGALPLGEVRTTPGYRLVALGDVLDRPGMVRDPEAAGQVTGELWRLPRTALADLLVESRPPLGLGWVDLADGRSVLGYLAEHAALRALPSLPGGSWRSRPVTV